MRIDVDAIIEQLTLEQQATLLDGHDYWHTEPLEQYGVESEMMTDGPHGLRKQAGRSDQFSLNNAVPATCFPTAAALASSWDEDLLRKIGVAVADECRAAGVAVLLGPAINIKRTPLCGRNFEYFSEDPHLTGVLAAAMVEGVQSRGVGSAPKHFAANNQETDRMAISVVADERTLREIYLAAFERIVKQAHPWTLMCSYNRINGIYASENHWLLTEVLRDEWGFDGMVMSDWGAVDRRGAALVAGLDLEMPSSSGVGTAEILAAVQDGELDAATVTRSARRVLAMVARATQREPLPDVDFDAHHELARAAARASAVLLKNEGELLPIDPAEGGSIAVIGEFARTPRFQGGGSSQVNPTRVDAALQSLRESVAGRRDVAFAPGYKLEADAADEELIAEAVALAVGADVAVVFLGLPPTHESEGFDRDSMDLPAGQLALLAAVAAANPRTAVVLVNGSAVLVAELATHARALIEGWLLGQGGGAAIADLLLGVASPSGKLSETLPVAYEHNPTIGNFPGEHHEVNYGERLLVGYRWYDTHALPVAFPFGHGLSYTNFEYTDLTVTVRDDGPEPEVRVELTLTNTGARDGAETVQVYVSDVVATVSRPAQELRAFQKVELAAGEQRRIHFDLDQRAFAFWHDSIHGWVVEGGEFEIRVGSSSRDIRLRETLDLTGQTIQATLTRNSTAAEFFEHPETGPRLREMLPAWALKALEQREGLGEMLRLVPIGRLALFFPQSPVGSQLPELLAIAAASEQETKATGGREPTDSHQPLGEVLDARS